MSNLHGVSEYQGNGRSIDIAAEVVDMIIDHLHDCKPALQSCALVSRTWLPASRFHIFRSIELHPEMAFGQHQPRCQNLYAIVQRSPHILAIIRELRITEGRSISTTTDPWVNDMPYIVWLLESLTHLKTFRLRRFNWIRLTPELRGAFRRAIASNQLSNLKFQECKFLFSSLLSILNTVYGSISLTLSQVWLLGAEGSRWQEKIEMVKEEDAGYPALETKYRFHALRIVQCPPAIRSWLRGESGPDLSHLRSLRCGCDGPNRALLLQLGEHLQHLSIWAPFQRFGDQDIPILEHLTGLRSLHVTHINLRDTTKNYDRSGPSWLKELLHSFLSNTGLQHLKLKIFIQDSLVSDEAWAEVDRVLDGDTFSGLWRVGIDAQRLASPQSGSEVRNTLKSLLPGLGERGILEICGEPYD